MSLLLESESDSDYLPLCLLRREPVEPVSGTKLLSKGQVARLGIGCLFGFSKELFDYSSGIGLRT
jgi:hypothetical protein